jgi:hypothetical protein
MIRTLLPALLLLGGCAAQTGDFPSLAPRAIEKLDTSEPEATPAVVAPVDPALATRVAALLADAEAGDRDFAEARRTAEPRIIAGASASTGSDAWIAAQEAVSRLTAARNRTAAALQALDALAIEQADALAVTTARDKAAALDSAQQQVLEMLTGRLPQ